MVMFSLILVIGVKPSVISSVVINDQAVERVQKYAHLADVTDEKLTFERHVDVVFKKSPPAHLFLL